MQDAGVSAPPFGVPPPSALTHPAPGRPPLWPQHVSGLPLPASPGACPLKMRCERRSGEDGRCGRGGPAVLKKTCSMVHATPHPRTYVVMSLFSGSFLVALSFMDLIGSVTLAFVSSTHQLELAHKAMREIQDERDKLELEINNMKNL